jgi:hypothetical protein
MTRRLIHSGAGFLPPLAPAPSLPSGCSLACSQGLPNAADGARGASVARRKSKRTKPSLQSLFEVGVIWRADRITPREGSVVGHGPIETAKVAQPEGPEPGPKDAPSSYLLQCLYLAERCDRRCAGCEVEAAPGGAMAEELATLASAAGASEAGRASDRHPDGNHGENLKDGTS